MLAQAARQRYARTMHAVDFSTLESDGAGLLVTADGTRVRYAAMGPEDGIWLRVHLPRLPSANDSGVTAANMDRVATETLGLCLGLTRLARTVAESVARGHYGPALSVDFSQVGVQPCR
jgi:hypothetical protein